MASQVWRLERNAKEVIESASTEGYIHIAGIRQSSLNDQSEAASVARETHSLFRLDMLKRQSGPLHGPHLRFETRLNDRSSRWRLVAQHGLGSANSRISGWVRSAKLHTCPYFARWSSAFIALPKDVYYT